jgi:protein-S-isoprenylcysteine O-methyltransferase Ste14
MSNSSRNGPNVKIVPPLVFLAGILVGSVANIWMPTRIVPNPVVWAVGGIFVVCGLVLTGSAALKFKSAGTTVRPDRAPSALVMSGPYRISRNPMYLGLAVISLGIAIADQSFWTLIALAIVVALIQRHAIEPEEAFLEKRFGTEYLSYKHRVRRWI